MNNEHTKAALARDEHVDIPIVALEDLPAVAAALQAATPSEIAKGRAMKNWSVQ
jgi:hypothetical protein